MVRGFPLLEFYIFKGENDYIKHCKTRTCMAIQRKGDELYLFLFKELMLFFKILIPNGISQYNMRLSILNGHGSHVTIEILEHA
jgi:hypothetical protein